MKTFKSSLVLMTLCLCLGIFSHCQSSDDPEPHGIECPENAVKVTTGGITSCECIQLDLSQLSAGMYVLKIATEEKVAIAKLIKE